MNPLADKRVLIGPSSFAASDRAPMDRLLESGCEVIENPFKRKLTKTELFDLLSDGVTGLIAGLEPLDREVLQRSALKVISRCGAGLSNVDLAAAKELRIQVRSTPDGPTSAVAELTVGAMLNLLRMLPQMDQDLHDGKWRKIIGRQLEGKTVVIIGFGRIGRAVAERLGPFKAKILVVDPYLAEPVENFPLVSLGEALRQADIITLHCSGDDPVLGEADLALLKPGALLLNAARGGVVDEESLVKLLEEGRVAGAWLDTFAREPYTGPLTRYPQALLTPHVGSYTAECRRRMEMETVENLLEAFAGLSGSCGGHSN